MIEYVVGVDPGKLTGVAGIVMDDQGDISKWFSAELAEHETGVYLRSILDTIWKQQGLALYLACERFIITTETAKNSQAPWSLEQIGILKQCCWDAGYPLGAVAWQTPSAAKNFATNEKLKRFEIWHKGGNGHANDALRHALLCLVNRGWTHSKLLR